MKHQELIIEGMSCGHCVFSLKNSLKKISGLTIEHVEVGKARVQYDEITVKESAIVKAVEDAGYKVI